MSRAFVKDDDDRPEQPIEPERGPYYVAAADLDTLDDDRRARAVVVEREPFTAGFGARVAVRDESGAVATYRIVNDEDADPAAGSIGVTSPLARALEGARAGDRVLWQRPAGDLPLHVEEVDETER